MAGPAPCAWTDSPCSAQRHPSQPTPRPGRRSSMATKDLLGTGAEEASEDDAEFNGEGSPPASPEGEGDDLADSSGARPTRAPKRASASADLPGAAEIAFNTTINLLRVVQSCSAASCLPSGACCSYAAVCIRPCMALLRPVHDTSSLCC